MNTIPASIDTLTPLGAKPDAARRALWALERAGLVKTIGKNMIEIVSPTPDPILHGLEVWRAFFIAKYGLVSWPTVGGRIDTHPSRGRGEVAVLTHLEVAHVSK